MGHSIFGVGADAERESLGLPSPQPQPPVSWRRMGPLLDRVGLWRVVEAQLLSDTRGPVPDPVIAVMQRKMGLQRLGYV